MSFYAPFTLPFIIGTTILFLVLIWKYLSWFFDLPRSDKRLIFKGIPTFATLRSLWEVVRECLLHVRIFKVVKTTVLVVSSQSTLSPIFSETKRKGTKTLL